MLAWVVKPVDSPYGAVDTLHWAVPDEDDDEKGDCRKMSTGQHPYGEEDADPETALQVELESAEDQLGAVLWNSNTAALNYLHRRVLTDRTSAPTTTDNNNKSSGSACAVPPLKGLRVVELGAGVGCLGIALAMGGAAVAVTDLKELLPLLKHNITINERAVAANSRGAGRCTAFEWRWGPSVSTNPKKYAGAAGAPSPGSPAARMLEALRAPSTPFKAAEVFFGGPETDLVVLCDALYGNPKDWPFLLYTLTELLSANPAGCTIVNFCEQRVDNVEGKFLDLLRRENETNSVVAAAVGGGSEGPAAPSPSASPALAGEELKAEVLARVLREKRGNYRWAFETEAVAEEQSELNMTIRATVIRWVKAGDSGEARGARDTTSATRGDRKRAADAAEERTSTEPPRKRTSAA